MATSGRLLVAVILTACASRPKDETRIADPLSEAEWPPGAQTRFDLGNGALKFLTAAPDKLPEDEFQRMYAYGPIIVVRTEFGTRRFDFRDELRSWDWVDVNYDEARGRAWAFLEYTVGGPGDTMSVLATFDSGLTWKRLKDIPKPHHAARYRGFRRFENTEGTVEVTFALEADIAPEIKNPSRAKELLFRTTGADLGRSAWSAPRQVR